MDALHRTRASRRAEHTGARRSGQSTTFTYIGSRARGALDSLSGGCQDAFDDFVDCIDDDDQCTDAQKECNDEASKVLSECSAEE